MLHALTRSPSPSMTQACLLTHLSRKPINFSLARQQHDDYCAALGRWGVTVHKLEALLHLPDSVFVEDAAVILDEVVVFARSGARERMEEPAALEAGLRAFARQRSRIVAPGMLDGGDVLRVGRRLLVGVSGRTNVEGATQLRAIAQEYGYEVDFVPVGMSLHLKTACTALRDDVLLINPAWVDTKDLPGFDIVDVHPGEPFAANVLRLPNAMICDGDSPRTLETVRGIVAGYSDVDTVHVSEFGKAEGSLTCMSIVFCHPAV